MRHALIMMVVAPLLVSVAGCDPDPTACTADARTSLILSVVDAGSGEPVDATVTYLVDGEEPSSPPEKAAIGRYLLGQEVDGTFEVTASADGYEPATRDIEVTSDECHVITVEETIELTPAP